MVNPIYAVFAYALFTLAMIADPFFGFPPAPPTPAPAPTAVATATAIPAPTLHPVAVVMTAYTCAPGTPMFPCGLTANGTDPAQPGMACPRAWMGQTFVVEGFGELRCDDTGAYSTLTINGRELPHIDVRVPTVEQAYQIGFREANIYTEDPP